MKQFHKMNKLFNFSLIVFFLFNISCSENTASHYFKNGNAQYQLKNYEMALNDLDKAIELEDDYFEAYYVRALCYGNLQEYEKARYDFDKVIELDPNFKDAYLNRGFYVFEKTGDFQTAINDYDTYLDLNIDGDNSFAYDNRGFAKYKLSDYEGAMDDIQESININPDNSFAYKNRALIYISLDSLNLACQDLEKAKALGFSKEYGSEVNVLMTEFCNQD